MKKNKIIILAILLITTASYSQIENKFSSKIPQESIKNIIELLKSYNPKYNMTEAEKNKNIQLKKRLTYLIDIYLMGKLALEDHWGKMTIKQRNKFYALFIPLVQEIVYSGNAVYLAEGKVKIKYEKDKIINPKLTRVNSKIYVIADDITTQTDYLLYKDDKTGEWRMRDLYFDMSSVVNDYKNQFNLIIRKWGLKKLYSLMEKKYKSVMEKKKKEK